MQNEKIYSSDLHVHTNLSLCAPRTTTLESYLPYCMENGICQLGVSNHIYKPELLSVRKIDDSPVELALRIRKDIDELSGKYPIDLLLGCEVETFFGQQPTLSKADSRFFDYVLLAPSHIFNLMHEYAHFDLSTPLKVHDLILEQFRRACLIEFDAPIGICHPLYPISCPWEQEIVDSFTRDELEECFRLAAERDISIEIHACLMRKGTKLDADGLSPSYLRMLSIAKECGCKFHFGSDAHEPAVFDGANSGLELAARRLGITRDDLWSVVRRG